MRGPSNAIKEEGDLVPCGETQDSPGHAQWNIYFFQREDLDIEVLEKRVQAHPFVASSEWRLRLAATRVRYQHIQTDCQRMFQDEISLEQIKAERLRLKPRVKAELAAAIKKRPAAAAEPAGHRARAKAKHGCNARR